ncbi:tetratricopeptide repeat protein [Mariniblastus fucicola]|uniref:hypothetical protein n=1 Tax=Mariniblastus fucicola TaxID=980251 RepID=UPI0011DFD4A8|nr:hypothetical protein [Mariniblastus fucicola]
MKPLEGESRQSAAVLVRQLGSSNYELRQQATRALWEIGSPVLELLRVAADGGANSEARMRAKDLVTLIEVGVEHDADADVVRCIVGFLDREILVQGRAIRKLCHLQQRSVAKKLIELVPSEADRESLREFCSMAASDAEVALRLGEDEKFEEWINDPATRESQKLLFYYYLWVDNKLDSEIELLKVQAQADIATAKEFAAKLEKEKAKHDADNRGKKNGKAAKFEPSEKPPGQEKLLTLIGLLRFTERWAEAEEFADQVYDKTKRRNLTHSILMESGNWKRLSELMVEPEDGVGEDEKYAANEGLAYPATGYRRALVQFYAGQEADFEATISELESEIEEEFRKQKQAGVKEPGGNSAHANFLRYTLDFDRALKFDPLKKNLATYQMLSRYRRYEKLFDVFNLETYEKRVRYFKGRARHIRSLQKRVEYHTQQREEDEAETYSDKRDLEIENWRNIVGLLATLGFNEDAELYYRQLYFEFSDKVSYIAFRTIADLQAMSAYQSAWEIAEIESKRNREINLRGALLNPGGYDHQAVGFLDSELSNKIEDPIERYRKIAALVKSPADPGNEKVDFWQEIGALDFTDQTDAIRHLFMIWGLEEEQLFQRSASLDGSEMLQRLMRDGEFLLAAQKYEALALTDGYPVHYAQAWDAYRKGGDATKARQMRFLFALKFDAADAYDYTSGYSGFEWQALPFDAFRLHDCLEQTDVGENCYYMWRIAEGDAKAVLSAHQKMVRTQILRLRYIDSPYLEDSEEDHPRFIEGSLQSGDIVAARRWFNKLSDFQPADSGFVENNFPLFEKLGNKEFVDEMFEKVSADFYRILEVYPDSAMYRNNYAWACACAKRNVENGIAIAKRAVELRPGTAGYLDTLAELYHVNGQRDLAISTIRRAIEINPMRAYYHEQLKKFKGETPE